MVVLLLWLSLVVLFFGSLVALFRASFYKIPANCFAEPRIFGWRAPFTVKNWMFWWPFIGSMSEAVYLEIKKVDDRVAFTTSENNQGDNPKGSSLTIAVPYHLEYAVDPNLNDKGGPNNGRNTFLGLAASVAEAHEEVKTGLNAYVKAKLGALGGIKSSDDFQRHLKRIEDYMKAFLQLKKLPHLNHDRTQCGVANCTFAGKIKDSEILEFYEDHWEMIQKEVKSHASEEKLQDHSEKELFYGIDIKIFILGSPEYSEEDRRAFSEKRKEAERAKAAATHVKVIGEIKDALPGLPQTEVADYAQNLLNGVPKSIKAIRGPGEILVVESNDVPPIIPRKPQKQTGDDKESRKGGKR